MNNERKIIRDALSRFTLDQHGDLWEKKLYQHGNTTSEWYEKFWQLYIVPCTDRVNIDSTSSGNLREELHHDLLEVSRTSYSIVRHIVRIEDHLEDGSKSNYYYLYSLLTSIADLMDRLIIYYICTIESNWTKIEEMVDSARGNIDHSEYKKAKILNSIKKKLSFSIPVISSLDIIRYLSKKTHLGQEYYSPSFYKLVQDIRTYRNIFVHNPKILEVYIEGELFLPSINKVGQYKNWNVQINHQDLISASKLFQNHYNNLLNHIVKTWQLCEASFTQIDFTSYLDIFQLKDFFSSINSREILAKFQKLPPVGASGDVVDIQSNIDGLFKYGKHQKKNR